MTVAMPFTKDTSGDLRADRRYVYGMGALRDSEAGPAIDLLKQCLELVPDWLPAWFGLGEALLASGDLQAAGKAFQHVLALDSSDCLGAGAYLVRISGDPTSGQLSSAFVTTLFDEYAPRFDSHLVDTLEYCAPALLVSALDRSGAHRNFARVLDLGCGTGLMAKALGGRASRIDGVDLSGKMLNLARETGLYAELTQSDLLALLRARVPGSADLILAADVFCYVIDLEPVFAAALPVIVPGGHFAFTIETHDGRDISVGDDRRVHHVTDNVVDLAIKAGFSVKLVETASTRMDRGMPVPGAVIVLAKG